LWTKKKSNASLLAISNQVKQECAKPSSTAAPSLCTIQDGKPNNLDENEGDEKAWTRGVGGIERRIHKDLDLQDEFRWHTTLFLEDADFHKWAKTSRNHK
jgi:hypothetical protein